MNTQDTPSRSESISRRHLLIGSSIGFLGPSSNAKTAKVAGKPESDDCLADQLAIKRLIYRYAMALDNLDGVAMAECFAPDAVLQGGGLNLQRDIAGELIRRAQAARSPQVQFTMHVVQNHWYEVQENVATGMTYCVASSVAGAEGSWKKTDTHIQYDDELVKHGGRWQFLKRRYQPLWVIEGPVIDYPTFMAQIQKGRQ